VFARRPAAKISPGNQNSRALKLRLIKWMIRVLLAVVFESVFAQAVECDAAKKASRNNAVGVNVVQQKWDGGGLYRFDFVQSLSRLVMIPEQRRPENSVPQCN
jgi:hypothetical protein